jgi:protein SCO1/2
MRILYLIVSILLYLSPVPQHLAFAHSKSDSATENVSASKFDNDRALAISLGAIDNQVGKQNFINAFGEKVSLSSFAGKPLLLSMIYTSCYHICPTTIHHLSKVVEKARETLGQDSFSVAVVGFDSRFDTPEAMRIFGQQQGLDDKGWNLLSIAHADVDRLAKDIGFAYYPSSNGFDHIIQTTILDSESIVYRQIYGQTFETPLLVDPLIELVLGRPTPEQTFLSGVADKIKVFCTTYDPVRDGYYFDYSLFLGMLIGASIILYTLVIMVREFRKGRIST